MRFCVLFLLQFVLVRFGCASLYKMKSDGRCFYQNISQYLTTERLVNELQCAALCSTNNSCYNFMTVRSNWSCVLYSSIYTSAYASLTYATAGLCKIGLSTQQQDLAPATTTKATTTPTKKPITYSVFTATTTWTVPEEVSFIMGLCIGGGAGGKGGLNGAGGGGGSGLLSYNSVTVTPNTSIVVTIGSRGLSGSAGEMSSIGSFVSASGGSASNGLNGGSGGSGGGCGSTWAQSSCNGGDSGNSGNTSSPIATYGGIGQGTTQWYEARNSLNTASQLVIGFGSGGAGHSNTDSAHAPGGGGGGGILINGSGPSGGSGTAPYYAGGGGNGYGSGGGSAGCYAGSCNFLAGAGAPGVCVIAY